MEAIIILLIISFQFALIYFGVKCLSALNERLILLNEKVESLSCLIEPAFEKVRKGLAVANNVMNKYIENEGKIKVIKLILLVYSLVVAISVIRKKKNIFSFYSLYDIIIKTTKAILGF